MPFDEARVHVLTPAFKYGATVFEGLRGYWNAEREQMFLFRVTEHLDRLQAGMRVMRFADAVGNERLSQSLLDLAESHPITALGEVDHTYFEQNSKTLAAYVNTINGSGQ